MPNRLAKETSPYLLQHAHNPVDWYPWGAEALERARAERKPILLSIGYSACHWCHVMERESFEDAETARMMNDLFVNVKVDREERPDLDSIYMQAVQAMTGHGGWPMTTFLTPELEPFWAGTYFPPQDRPGMPSFRRVMAAVSDAWRNRPADVQRVAATMREMFEAAGRRTADSGRRGDLSAATLEAARRGLLQQYDPQFGGFGGAPKFPHAMAMEFLLTQWARTGDRESLDAARTTFIRMARGGIYDHVGGGFARYAVDEQWLVPHFEKMLYDNALLTRLGVHLWQATKDAEIRRVCEETLEWLAREMTAPSGGFYSTLDADSDGEEGRFYLWDEDELRRVLGADAQALLEYWGVTRGGNFEGRNILHVASEGRRPAEAIAKARKVLYDVRTRRTWPARDEKVIASWNGLMLRAVCEAAAAFESASLRQLAVRNGEFLFREMVRDGRVFRSHKDGVTRIGGYLEDHAAVALGALALYEVTFDDSWLERAMSLAEATVRWFWDESGSAVYDTATDHEQLLTRPRDITDNATPAGSSLAIELFLRLGNADADEAMLGRAEAILSSQAEQMARHPLGFGHALMAADLSVFGPIEVGITGNAESAEFRALRAVVSSDYTPNIAVFPGDPTMRRPNATDDALTEDAKAHVCRGMTCLPPITDPGDLRAALLESRTVRA